MELLHQIESTILLGIQNNIRTPLLTSFFSFITHLGDAGIIWIALCIILLIFRSTRDVGVRASLSLLAAFLINNLLLKNIFNRTRPFYMIESLSVLIKYPSDASFPSGHSAAAFAVAAALIFAGAPKKISIPATVLAVLMAFSRLYLGVHYPSDVICGAVIGTFCAAVSVFVLNRIKARKDEKKRI